MSDGWLESADSLQPELKQTAVLPLISLIVPVFNEESIVFANLAAILDAAGGSWYRLELIAVDDGSTDATAQEISRAAALDARIRMLSFTRNFGKEAAILAGLAEGGGDAVVVLDADLQHPPQLIPQMLNIWRQGVYVVEAVKLDRGNESLFSRLFAHAFYAVFRRFAGVDLKGHSDFKLLDRCVVDFYLGFSERHLFFRGIIGWAEFPSAQIPFDVPERAGGASRWSKWKLVRYAIDNVTSFSGLPLKLVSWLGMGTLMFGIIMGSTSLVQKMRGEAIDGFTTVNLLIIIMGSAIFISLGIIGHYIMRLYDEIKARPPYIIKPPGNSRRP